jgi:hypothetical protein
VANEKIPTAVVDDLEFLVALQTNENHLTPFEELV